MPLAVPPFTHCTAQAIAKEIGVACEEWMQDWPIEVADGSRVEEFFTYFEAETRPDFRRAALALVIVSLDEVFGTETCPQPLLPRIGSAIREFPEVVEYWSCPDAESDMEMFNLTPWIRTL